MAYSEFDNQLSITSDLNDIEVISPEYINNDVHYCEICSTPMRNETFDYLSKNYRVHTYACECMMQIAQ
jgi:hypothetical protein